MKLSETDLALLRDKAYALAGPLDPSTAQRQQSLYEQIAQTSAQFSRQLESISPSSSSPSPSQQPRKPSTHEPQKSEHETLSHISKEDNLWHSLNRGISEFDKGLFYEKYMRFVEERRRQEQEQAREREVEREGQSGQEEELPFDLRYPAKNSFQLQSQIDELYSLRKAFIRPAEFSLESESLLLYDFLMQVFIWFKNDPEAKTVAKQAIKAGLR